MPSVCATNDGQKNHINVPTAKRASDPLFLYVLARCILRGSFLFSRFVGAIAGEVKKLVLRVFAAVDVGVRSLVIRDMQISHPWSLASQLIADHRETGAIEGGPHFLNF